MPVGEKVEKSRNTVFFQCFVAPEGLKVGSLKGAEPFGQMKDEQLRAVVVRSTFPCQNAKRTTLEVEMSKKCTPFWREANFEVKPLKTPGVLTTFGH